MFIGLYVRRISTLIIISFDVMYLKPFKSSLNKYSHHYHHPQESDLLFSFVVKGNHSKIRFQGCMYIVGQRFCILTIFVAVDCPSNLRYFMPVTFPVVCEYSITKVA
jgi:hypothetical protein